MVSAKLIKNLEKKGFFLDFPEYESIEEEINEILQSNNQRLLFAIPLLLEDTINIKKIKQSNEFSKILCITKKIFDIEGIKKKLPNTNIPFSESEFESYYNQYKLAKKTEVTKNEAIHKKTIRKRNNLQLEKQLDILFSPAKIRIMRKIEQYQTLTNTELKYYYRSIRPILQTISDQYMQEYAYLIERLKKQTK